MIVILSLSVLCFVGCSLAAQISFSTPSHQDDTYNVFITPEINNFIEGILKEYNSPGLSLALVRRNETYPTGWLMEFGSYGTAKADGSPVTPDSLFAIASNSKLFLSLSVGLLIENQTLADQMGRELSWSSRAIDVIPQWGLMDEDMERIVNIQDMLSHRTGMPRHDQSGRPLQGGVAEMISNLRYLRPSAEARETWQYNNLMYETLSYLPELLLDQPFESYVADHLFNPLNMSASTYSVAIAEKSSEHMAHGYMRSMRDEITGVSGILTPVVPYFSRPGNEKIWAGAGGVITSARDLSVWVAMLLGNGKHPFTNVTVVPEKLIQHIAEGVAVIDGTPSYPELSASMYGAGQERYTYRGHDLIEHGGSNPGFKTQVTRFPNDNLGIVVLSNDEDFGTEIHQIVIRRIADEILVLDPLDWKIRLLIYNPGCKHKDKKFNAEMVKMALPRPEAPCLPTAPIASMEGASFMHPTYGLLQPCYIEPEDTLAIPTLIIPYNGFFVTYIMLRHFCGNLFNGSIIWSNWVVREKEGYHHNDENVGKDIIIGFDNRFEVEWVHETKSAQGGLAFKGGFWGKGKKAKAPMGTGKESAEVWFGKV
ncbi:beta-lactamase/transpeptidase-like protein [Lentinula lateritia]|uniref:Beta-lactamase/transpeptidase-like protein n=1 Tax=Lentinula lateritia TaxID=40482 RepID=A0ABQ8UZP9_9AGAR|nr:beta-lactamase/transpeptidase-like protein [Lentinula lateritia]